MKILAVTGITGKSGQVFAWYLSKNMVEIRRMYPDGIRILVREKSDTVLIDELLPDAEKCIGDLTDKGYLKKVLTDTDTVFHIAGIHWSREVIEACSLCGVRRVITVHTTGIYSKYKAAGEEYRNIEKEITNISRESSIALTILRPTMIYGNQNDKNMIQFIKMIDKLPVMPIVNHANYDLQPVHYEDLGKAYYLVLTNETTTVGKEFILSGEKPISLHLAFEIIGDYLGKSVKFISCPFSVAYVGAWMLFFFSLGRLDFREKVQRLCESRAFPHNEAENAFGYHPMSFETGISSEVKEYLKHR